MLGHYVRRMFSEFERHWDAGAARKFGVSMAEPEMGVLTIDVFDSTEELSQ